MKLLIASLLLLATAYGCSVLQAPNAEPGDQFGYSVFNSGNLLVSSSPFSHGGKGSVYLYNCANAPSCTFVTELQDPNGAEGDLYGSALAINGRLVVVGAPGKNNFVGAFFVYDCDANGCTPYPGNPFVVPGLTGNAQLGSWAAIENNMVAVTAVNQTNSGAAYLFSCSSWACSLITTIQEPGTNIFGWSATLNNGVLVLHGRVGPMGGVYLYSCGPSGCTPFPHNPLTSPLAEPIDDYGFYFSLCGSYLTVGSLLRSNGSGAIEGYYCTAGDCVPSPSNPILSPNNKENGNFGDIFSCSGNWVITGGQGEDNGRGRSYLYSINPTSNEYTLEHTFDFPETEDGDFFGWAIDMTGNFIAISAPYAREERGLVYVTKKSAPYSCQSTSNPNFAINDLTGIDPELYGGAVAISGSLLVVGASDKTIDFDHQGAAVVYNCDKTHCTQVSQLVAFDAADFDNFGYSVAVDGQLVVVGAPSKVVGVNEFQGAAYVYSCPPTGCSLVAKLTSASGAAFDDFGTSVAVSGNLIVIGADQTTVNGNEGQGQAHLFECLSATFPTSCGWVSTLDCTSCSTGDLFGYSVSISGNFVTVGAPFADVGSVSLQGQVEAFDCTNPSACVSLGSFTSPSNQEESFFGWSVTASGWHALVGSPFESFHDASQGVVYPVDCTGGSCSTKSPLRASDADADDFFGYSVSLSGSSAVFGASNQMDGKGSAYLFDCTIFEACKEVREYGSAILGAGASFGASVSISGNLAAVSAPNQIVSGNPDRGQVFIFGAPTPTCASIIEGNANWGRGTLNTRVYGTCQTGFVGTPFRWCQLNSTYGPITNPCAPQPTTCPAQTYGNAAWLSTAVNTMAAGTCVSGYSGSPSRKCFPDGSWSTSIVNLCTRNFCAASSDGIASYPKTWALDTARGTCPSGFVGSPQRVCDANGAWGVVTNPCASASCPAETYGRNVFAQTPAGQTATGTCIPGYQGSPQRQCFATGWSTNVVNNCNRITCPATTTSIAHFNQGNSGTVVFGTCLTGTGNPRMTCDINGQWVNPSGTCI